MGTWWKPWSWCNPLCSIKRKELGSWKACTEFLKPWGSPDFFGVLTRVSWLRGFWIASEWGLVPERPNYDWKLGTQPAHRVWERDWRWRLITKGHWFNQRPLVYAHVTKTSIETPLNNQLQSLQTGSTARSWEGGIQRGRGGCAPPTISHPVLLILLAILELYSL